MKRPTPTLAEKITVWSLYLAAVAALAVVTLSAYAPPPVETTPPVPAHLEERK